MRTARKLEKEGNMRSRSSILVLSALVLLGLAVGLPAAIAQYSTPDDNLPQFPDDRYRPGLPNNDDDDDSNGDDDNGGGCNQCDQQVMMSGVVGCYTSSYDPGHVRRNTYFEGAVGISFSEPEMGFNRYEEFTGDAADATDACVLHFQEFLQNLGFITSEIDVGGGATYISRRMSFVYGGSRNDVVSGVTQLIAEVIKADIH
jgi:hypothetical protein